MRDIEYRFFEMEYRAAAGTVRGTAVRYGDLARIPAAGGPFNERIQAGAFGNIGEADVILNVQHDRRRPVARTGGGGLVLTDGADRLDLAADLPSTRDAEDARELLRKRILRGLSVEMVVVDDLVDPSARLRTIRKAELRGVGIVDRPAYGDSKAVLARFEQTEDRAAVDAVYTYGQDETMSDTGRRRKRRFKPGSFRGSIRDPGQEITLSIGRNPNELIGSQRSGTLVLEDTDDALIARVQDPPDTAAWRDFEAKRAAGNLPALVPLIRELEGGFVDVPEPGNPDVLIRVYDSAKLYGLALVFRAPKGTQSEVREAALWRLPIP